MVQAESSLTGVEKVMQPRVTEFQRLRRVFFGRKVVLFGMVVICILLLTAIFAPLLARYDPYEQHMDQVLLAPNSQYWLGTDTIGRDILSRIIYGSRTSLAVGIVALGIAATIGITIGLTAAYFGGWVYNILMRIVDSLMCFPMILLALVIAALLGGGITNVMIALGIALLPGYARIMSAQVLSVKENDYILAEHATGAGHIPIMFRHIFPNCLPPLIVMVTMQLGAAILAEAGLSFLGVGIQPPAAAWGSMVNDGRQYLISNPILSFAPGVAIMLVVFSFNMVGDGLRDALDPRLRGTL
jgi:peptide/nickel transport system permease protein